MMGKGLLLITAGIVVGGVILAKKTSGGEGMQARGSIEVQILDSFGNPLPRTHSYDLTEGETYTFAITVTNQSTKGGAPCAAQLRAGGHAYLPDLELVSLPLIDMVFAAGESQVSSGDFTVPMDYGGVSGAFLVRVWDPAGNILAEARDNINIIGLPIDYSATIAPTLV